MRSPLSRSLAFALMVGSFATLSPTSPALASHPGSGDTLTISTGQEIVVLGGSTINPLWWSGTGEVEATVPAAQWSPDGSRAVFINQYKDVQTVRHNDGGDYWYVARGDADGNGFPDMYDRADPTYFEKGKYVVWAQKQTADSRWGLAFAESSNDSYVWAFTTDDNAAYTAPDGGNSRLVYQRTPDAGSPEVWIFDGPFWDDRRKIADGSRPAISPDETKVAFEGSDGQIWVVNTNGAPELRQVSQDVGGGLSNPTWSPDGNTIAVNHGNTTRTVPLTGGTSSLVSSTAGIPAYRSHQQNKAIRLAGTDRYETAAAVSKHWKSAGTPGDDRPEASAVVLSRSDTFADALGGSALAAAKSGPLLLTDPATLTPATATEIKRVLGNNNLLTVYVLGSAGAISNEVEQSVKDLGYVTKRVAGPDRFATAVEIANEISDEPQQILVATGTNFPDALAAGAAAGAQSRPEYWMPTVVVLTDGNKLPTATKNYLLEHDSALKWTVGRAASDAYPLPLNARLVGQDRYETAWLVADRFFGGHQFAGIATGNNWPDALAGGALMGTLNGPLLLTNGTAPELSFDTWFHMTTDCAAISTVYVFGSTAVVNQVQLEEAGKYISGPAGFTTGTSPVIPDPVTIRDRIPSRQPVDEQLRSARHQ